VFFHKIDTPENFSFGSDRRVPIEPRLSNLGEGVFRFEVRSKLWKTNYSHAALDEAGFDRSCKSLIDVSISADGGVRISRDADALFGSKEGQGFGLSGSRWMMVFDYESDTNYYGLGEKYGSLEKTGVRTRYWNTDVMSDFPLQAVAEADVDPLYVTIPYLLVVRPQGTVGILLDNPFASFMSLAAVEGVAQLPDARSALRTYIGSPDGKPILYFIVGETPLEVTRKLQRLCGRTPMPPLWALGHHQCRWGYKSAAELKQIADTFRSYGIPNDGLWLDIDYMDAYRVFTFNKTTFSNPERELSSLADSGRVCPILDPGVKVDPGYEAYDEALSRGLLCMNPEGKPYSGFVWPGQTVFPDFSLEKTRTWWAGHVARLAGAGVSGVWVDMNDPSTGSADYDDMLFGEGKFAHETYHNQYALGMQSATRDGFLAARPNERPFILSRSGYISTSRLSAVWTGDNMSNYTNLSQSIPTCLNLSLSGVPFVGSDVGGFDGDATPELLVDWYKSAFLFPMFRNHSGKSTRRQEPWAMGAGARKVITTFIRARYKMLPYLYSLFAAQESSGEPILRPMFLEFPQEKRIDLSRVGDQFMVGPSVMQAPFVVEGQQKREVQLPSGLWFDASQADHWVKGGRKISESKALATTPIYIREGSIVPMSYGEPTDRAIDTGKLEVHLFVARRGRTSAQNPAAVTMVHDDGLTFDYRVKQVRSTLTLKSWASGNSLHVDVSEAQIGYRPFELQFHLYDRFQKIVVHGADWKLSPAPSGWKFCGNRVNSFRCAAVTVDR